MSSFQVPKFSYLPLRTHEEIRLLILKPGPTSAPLRCALAHVILSSLSSNYQALSYTWGSTFKPCLIYCDTITSKGTIYHTNSVIEITANLDAALRHLRHRSERKVLWIDAICIDQRNEKERDAQVLQMREIFSRSECTVVWLGEADDTTADASKCIEILKSTYSNLSSSQRESLAAELAAINHRPWLLKICHSGYIQEAEWQALERLLRRPWFSRVWVFQEVTVSSLVIVKCGTCTILWNDICLACNAVEQFNLDMGNRENQPLHAAVLIMDETHSVHSRPLLEYPAGASAPVPPSDDRFKTQKSLGGFEGTTYPGLDTMLLMMRWTKATDPRDKVYAILGISSGFSKLDLVPDYSISVRDAYIRTAVVISQMGRLSGLAFLSFVQHSDRGLSLDLPSWTPDWRRPLDAPWLISNSGFKTAINRQPKIAFRVRAFPGAQPSRSANPVGPWDSLTARGVSIMKIVVLSSLAGHRRALPPTDILKALPNPYRCSFEEAYKEGLDPSHNFFGSLIPSSHCSCAYPFWYNRLQSQRQDFEATKISWDKDNFQVLNHPKRPCDVDIAAWDRIDGVTGISHGRRLFVTDFGYLGLAPSTSNVGDEICVLFGGKVPYVFRREGFHCRFVGEGYIFGLMNGEVLERLEDSLEEDFIFI